MAGEKKIRVLITDDSVLARTIMTNGLSTQQNIEVVGQAVDAADAERKVKQLKPDVMLLDVEMPGLSGIELLSKLLPQYSLPVILVSSLGLRVFDALAAGAVDFVRKPFAGQSKEDFIKILTKKITMASMTKPRLPHKAPPAQAAPAVATLGGSSKQVIIGLGASTGGTEATLEVMKRLPEDIPGMVIVQHMPPGFTKMYAERLDKLCRMEVREAVDGDEIRPGLALVAPADLQARVVRSGGRYILTCKEGPKVSGHRPSVDALFHSMAEVVKCPMVGIIMTGMGRDGAEGLLAMRKAGAHTLGQDKESCVVYGMPMVAYEIGAVKLQADCENIAGLLVRHLKSL